MHLLPAVVLLTTTGVAAARADDAITPAALGPRVVRLTYEARATPPARAAPADIEAATYDPELASAQGAIRITDEVRAIARRETAGKPTVVAKAHALYDWVYDHMQYDKTVPGWGLGDIPYCLKVGKGNCTDFHTLFIALARASGIPARWNMGFPLAYGDGTA